MLSDVKSSPEGTPESACSATAFAARDDYDSLYYKSNFLEAFRARIRCVVNSNEFTAFITLCIILNTILLATDRYPIDK